MFSFLIRPMVTQFSTFPQMTISSWILHLKGSMQGRGTLLKTFLLHFTVLMQISMQFILIFFCSKNIYTALRGI